MRLNRFLASAAIGSRRYCDELIASGCVTINGKTCTDFSAQPGERDHVKVNGKLVHVAPPLTIMLHKPAGFVSTRKDPHVRDTVFNFLPAKFSRLFNIGRLDTQTEGLLLLTNDGDLAQSLTHPRYKIEKEYEVTLDRPSRRRARVTIRRDDSGTQSGLGRTVLGCMERPDQPPPDRVAVCGPRMPRQPRVRC